VPHRTVVIPVSRISRRRESPGFWILPITRRYVTTLLCIDPRIATPTHILRSSEPPYSSLETKNRRIPQHRFSCKIPSPVVQTENVPPGTGNTIDPLPTQPRRIVMCIAGPTRTDACTLRISCLESLIIFQEEIVAVNLLCLLFCVRPVRTVNPLICLFTSNLNADSDSSNSGTSADTRVFYCVA